LNEPEAELPSADDEDSPEPAPPANTSALSRQSALPMTDDGEEAVAGSAGPLFKVRCFGSFRVEAAEGEVSGWTIQKARELLAFLLAHGGAPVLRETVAEALWPEGDLAQVSHQLSNAAYYLRRTLASAATEVDNRVLVTANQRYHLRSGVFRVDVDAFDAHIARAEKLQGYEALVEYERALAIYTGDFMGDEAFEWAEVYRRDYQKRFVTAAHRAARLAFDSRDPKLAIRFYDAILARDPIDEEAARGIMRCHATLGDTNAVRRTYKALTAALRRDLEDDGAEPLPETQRLHLGLTGQESRSELPTGSR
jgi:two-component SAPR family response regulator